MSYGDGYRYSHFSIREEADRRQIIVFHFDHPTKPPNRWSLDLNEGPSMAEVGNRLIKLGDLLRGSSPIEQNATSSASESSARVDTAESKQNAPTVNPSAFPTIGEHPIHPDDQGMTLRDYFAIRGATFALGDKKFDCASPEMISKAFAQAAAHGYSFADAMLKARETK